MAHLTELTELVNDPGVGIDAIAAHLDALAPASRLAQITALGRVHQRRLYDKAAAAAGLALAHFTGTAQPGGEPSDEPSGEMIHDGWNTLPVPAPFRRFEKRFAAVAGQPDRVFGYNEGITRRAIGPGYFVAVATAGQPAWVARGAVVIDYVQVPDGPVPADWPRVVANGRGLQRFVYQHTRDFMRRVSRHVTIGAAYKHERPLDHYFVLCRRPASPDPVIGAEPVS